MFTSRSTRRREAATRWNSAVTGRCADRATREFEMTAQAWTLAEIRLGRSMPLAVAKSKIKVRSLTMLIPSNGQRSHQCSATQPVGKRHDAVVGCPFCRHVRAPNRTWRSSSVTIGDGGRVRRPSGKASIGLIAEGWSPRICRIHGAMRRVGYGSLQRGPIARPLPLNLMGGTCSGCVSNYPLHQRSSPCYNAGAAASLSRGARSNHGS
jgi:hypothetical protein